MKRTSNRIILLRYLLLGRTCDNCDYRTMYPFNKGYTFCRWHKERSEKDVCIKWMNEEEASILFEEYKARIAVQCRENEQNNTN